MVVVLWMMYSLLNSFGELIVRFVEQNQEHFKNQKHLVAKTAELSQDLKKTPSIVSNLKAVSRKFDTLAIKFDQNISRLDK